MEYSKIEQGAYSLACPIAEDLGYEIYDVQYVKEGPHQFLRIFITSESGVNLDDCEDISRKVSVKLDESNLIQSNYFLEVSSPGIERLLRQEEHFTNALGETVHLKLYSPVEGMKEAEGVLSAVDHDSITIQTEAGEYTILKKNIAKANIVFDFR